MTRFASVASVALAFAVAVCGEPAPAPEPSRAPSASARPPELFVREYFVLGVGVPSDLHLAYGARGSYEPSEAATPIAAECPDRRCLAELTPAGEVRVVPRYAGELALKVDARDAEGTRHVRTFTLEAATMNLEVVFDPAESRGARGGVVAGASVTWHTVLNDAHGTKREPSLEPSAAFAPRFDVESGDAVVETTRGTFPSLYDRPEAYLARHEIRFPKAGHVKLVARFADLARAVELDVVDPSRVASIEVRRAPEIDTYAGAVDVMDASRSPEGAPLTTVGLTYPNGSTSLALTVFDTEGRRAIGGPPEIGLELGSVVAVTPSEFLGGGLFFVVARTLGASTVRVRFGQATTSLRAEVR